MADPAWHGAGTCSLLLFTDLDGSLLDHHDYSYASALPVLEELTRLKIPVVPVSSKTRAEIEPLRTALGNEHPFVAENGAAVICPVGYFPEMPADCIEQDGYWLHVSSASREYWQALLEKLRGPFAGEWRSFADAGDEEVVQMTGLTLAQARLANQRAYSEPVQWLGSAERKLGFLAALRDLGAEPLEGGRFISVSGRCDKGRALRWLQSQYAVFFGARQSLAIGDSGNDVTMLEAADEALVIRSPAHEPPSLSRPQGVFISAETGPDGWATGVRDWLQRHCTGLKDNPYG